MERNSRVSHTVTVQLVDQNGRLLIAIWHLDAASCDTQKREGKNGLVSPVSGALSCPWTFFDRGGRRGQLSRLHREGSASPKGLFGLGGSAGGGLGRGQEAAIPRPLERQVLPSTGDRGPVPKGSRLLPCFQRWKDQSGCQDACSGHRETEQRTNGALSRGHPW